MAPAQFELAPVFEELNLACDHNMLVMEILRQTVERHGLVCLLHEKPFAGVNGSGKHNNWSINYGKRNLLNPGNDPHENAVFLTVLCAIIEAVDIHADLLRAAVTGAVNYGISFAWDAEREVVVLRSLFASQTTGKHNTK